MLVPTEEEMKISAIAEVYGREEKEDVAAATGTPRKKFKATEPSPASATPSSTNFHSEIRGELKSMNDMLCSLERGQKTN